MSDMTEETGNEFGGIYAATICPLTPDFRLDEAAIAAHVTAVVSVPGIKGILCNGHAGENFALDRDEKARVVEITARAAGGDAIIVAGVNQEDSLAAAA